ncbi:MAG: hypothetical protein LBJ00_00280 [Planctomycetaceae bacterium]|nr:hypothetical protein [Planctomycetaceae bacterium]
MKFPKLITQAQQREAVVQGRSLSPIPASVSCLNSLAMTRIFVCGYLRIVAQCQPNVVKPF